MRLSHINRYPVKGMSPDALRHSELQPDRGLPFDRAAAFTSGNLADPPRKGGWVRSRTFLQLTVYPELARFRTAFDEASRSVTRSLGFHRHRPVGVQHRDRPRH